MNPVIRQMHMQGMGADYTVNNLPPGWRKDYSGNVYDASGNLVYGPDVLMQTRPLSVESSPPVSNSPLITLPSGQQITAQQYQALLAQQQQPQNLLSAGATSTGIRIGNTNISYTMLLLGLGVVFLLQHKGFEKRK